MEYNTVTVELTTQEENLTDLANAYAQMGFIANMTEIELIENIKHVIQEQYTQAILNATPTPITNEDNLK